MSTQPAYGGYTATGFRQYHRFFVENSDLRNADLSNMSEENATTLQDGVWTDGEDSRSFRLLGEDASVCNELANIDAVKTATSFYNAAYLAKALKAVESVDFELKLKSRKDSLVWDEHGGSYSHAMYLAGFDDCFTTIADMPINPVVTLCNTRLTWGGNMEAKKIAYGGIASVVLAKMLTELGYSVRVFNHYTSNSVTTNGDRTAVLTEVQASEQVLDVDSLAYYTCDARYYRSFVWHNRARCCDVIGAEISEGMGQPEYNQDVCNAVATDTLATFGINGALLINQCDTIDAVIAEVRRVVQTLNERAGE